MKIFKKLTSNPASFVLLMFLVLFSFGQLERIQLANNMAFYLHDVLLIGWLISQREKLFKVSKKFFQKNKLFLLFLIWALFSWNLGLFLGRVNLKSLLYVGRLATYILFAVSLSLKKNKFSFSPRNGFVVASLFMSLMGILQYVLIPDARFLNILGWDNHYYRLIGPLLDPAFMGMVAVLGLVGLERIKKWENKWWGQLIFIATIALTFSRSSYLALGIVLGLLFWKEKKIRYVLLGLFFAITVILIPKPSGAGVDLSRTETLEARARNSWSGLSDLQGPQWVWGRGIFNNGNIEPSYTNQHAQVPDNLLVFLINSVGVVGTLILLKSFWAWSKEGLWWKKNKVWTIGLLAVLLHSMFNNTFLQPFVFLMLWGSFSSENQP